MLVKVATIDLSRVIIRRAQKYIRPEILHQSKLPAKIYTRRAISESCEKNGSDTKRGEIRSWMWLWREMAVAEKGEKGEGKVLYIGG